VTTEILTDLGIGAFTIKLNHRRLLDAMLDIAGVLPQKFRWDSILLMLIDHMMRWPGTVRTTCLPPYEDVHWPYSRGQARVPSGGATGSNRALRELAAVGVSWCTSS